MKPEEQLQMIISDSETLQKNWTTRNEQMRKDRDLVNIVKPPPKTDEVKWYTNEPKVFFDTARSLVSIYPPRFRLPIDINCAPEEKDRMNKAERLAVGIFRSLDNRVAEMGGVSWMWELAYWVLLGWYSVFNIVEKDSEGNTAFRADIWDTMTVFPEWDDKGLKRCVHAYTMNPETALNMAAGFQKKGLKFEYEAPKVGEPNVVNYWLREDTGGKPKIWNAISLNGVLAKELTLQKNLKSIPIRIGAIGSPDRISSGYQERQGESILYADRDMFDFRSEMISLMATVVSQKTFPNLLARLQNPNIRPFKAEDLKKGYGNVLAIKPNETIEVLKYASTPEEVSFLMQWVGQKIQEGSLPSTVYGSMPFELSGFAISQYMATLKYKLGAYLNAMQFVVSRIMTDFLIMFRDGNFKDVTLMTTERNEHNRTFIETFTKEDVPERLFVEVTIPIQSQFDKTQQILNAKQALTAPQLYSRETLWEMDGDVQDFEIEKQRIRDDQMAEDPFVRDMEILERMALREQALRVKGDTVRADALKNYIMLKEMAMGMRQGIPEKPGAPKQPGVPPNQMPPEARNSPDQARAMTGTPPSGVARRKQTPEERQMTKRGLIVSPNGQVIL